MLLKYRFGSCAGLKQNALLSQNTPQKPNDVTTADASEFNQDVVVKSRLFSATDKAWLSRQM